MFVLAMQEVLQSLMQCQKTVHIFLELFVTVKILLNIMCPSEFVWFSNINQQQQNQIRPGIKKFTKTGFEYLNMMI